MSRFATGVSVVTASGSDGEPLGFTANAVTSVSLDPLLVLVCVDRDSLSLPDLLDAGRFGVSFLRAGQAVLARRFAATDRQGRFHDVEVSHSVAGTPILSRSLAWLDCTVWKTVEAGDHLVVFGEVRACGTGADGDPLVFYGGRYLTVRS